jgi:hypothetical protein
MSYLVDDYRKTKHPGWAVQLDDGSFLCVAHGLWPGDAFYAHVMKTEGDAKSLLEEYINEIKNIGIWKGEKTEHYDPNRVLPTGKAVLAWEPMCAHLLYDVENLEKANKITPRTVSTITDSLREALSLIEEASLELNKDK